MVDDLATAIRFFAELGLVLQGQRAVEGRWVDRIVGARERTGGAVVAGLRARGAESWASWSAARTATGLLRPRPGGIIVELAERIG